jgi:hypothetical protein
MLWHWGSNEGSSRATKVKNARIAARRAFRVLVGTARREWLPDVALVSSEPEEGPQGRLQALPCRAALLAGFRQDKLLDFLAV